MTNIFESFSAKRAAELSGFNTVAMLDYLQRSNVFFPKGKRGGRGRGRARRYEFRDVLVLKAINKLLESGASVANLRGALEEFQKSNWAADPATLEDPEGIIRYLVVAADGLHIAKDAEILVNLSRKGQLAFSFIIDLEKLHRELRVGMGLPSLQHELSLDATGKIAGI